MQEVQGVISPGARTQTFVCKVKSHVSDNFYKVRMVEIGPAGTFPIEYGAEFEAVDVTDDFENPQADVPIGSVVVVSRTGNTCVFQKP